MITAGKSYWPEDESVQNESKAVNVDAVLFGPGVKPMGLDSTNFTLEQIKSLARGEHLKHHVAGRTEVFHTSFTLGKLQSLRIALLPEGELQESLKDIVKSAVYVAKKQYLSRLVNHNGDALNCVALAYVHITSSKGDPQVHVHVEIFNCGITKDNNYYSIRNARQEIFQKQNAAKAQFSLEMKNYFEKTHGLKVEKGDLVLKNPALQRAVVKEFSTVKEQIRQKVKEHGRKLTPSEYTRILQDVHKDNRKEVPRLEGKEDVTSLQKAWRDRAATKGLTSPEQFVLKDQQKEVPREWEAFTAVQKSVKHQEERKLSFTRPDFEARAFREAERMPESPTSKEVLQVVDKALQARSFAGIKKIEKDVWEDRGKGWEKQETRYHTRQSAEREDARTWAMWREGLKDVVKDVKATIKELIKEAKTAAKEAGEHFSLTKYCATELPSELTKLATKHRIKCEYSKTQKKPVSKEQKICLTLTADQVPTFLYRHSKTPYWQAHKRALWKAFTKLSLDKGSEQFEKERTPKARLHSGVIVVIQDPKGKVSDVHRALLRKLAKRDGSKIIVESPIKVKVQKQKEKEHTQQKGH